MPMAPQPEHEAQPQRVSSLLFLPPGNASSGAEGSEKMVNVG